MNPVSISSSWHCRINSPRWALCTLWVSDLRGSVIQVPGGWWIDKQQPSRFSGRCVAYNVHECSSGFNFVTASWEHLWWLLDLCDIITTYSIHFTVMHHVMFSPSSHKFLLTSRALYVPI